MNKLCHSPLTCTAFQVIARSLPIDAFTVSVILAAMPTMIFDIVLRERYKLDSGLYTAAVFLTTLVNIGSLMEWFSYLA